jgi:hypothetical protein
MAHKPRWRKSSQDSVEARRKNLTKPVIRTWGSFQEAER